MSWTETKAQKRKDDLAKIHIAKKDLDMDDDTYRAMIRDIGNVKSGSSADLDQEGRVRVLRYFRSKGWEARIPKGANIGPEPASECKLRDLIYD